LNCPVLVETPDGTLSGVLVSWCAAGVWLVAADGSDLLVGIDRVCSVSTPIVP
jgi:hypothetical protein